MSILFLAILGLITGSFLGALTWRLPRGASIVKGRSMCPHCARKLSWRDNIPVVSYFLLSGKARCCGKKISPRYPIIETTTAVLFVIIVLFQETVFSNLPWTQNLGVLALPFLLFTTAILIAIFVIDLEHQIIPDELIFLGLGVTFIALLGASQNLYEHLLTGLALALFLMLINLVTKGAGMGMGDVKFVIFVGAVLGARLGVIFIFTAFLTGAIVGSILILTRKAKFGKKIAFGPFLVSAFFIVILWAQRILEVYV